MEGFSLNSHEKVFFDPSKMDEEILKNNAPKDPPKKKSYCCPECDNLKTPCGADMWNPPKYTKKVPPVKKMRCRPKNIKRTTSEKVSIKFVCERMTPSDQSLENPCCNFDIIKCKSEYAKQNVVKASSIETIQCGDMIKIEKRTPSKNKCYQVYKTDFLFCDCKKDVDAKKSSTKVIDKLLSDFIIEMMDLLGITKDDSEVRLHKAFMHDWESYMRDVEEVEYTHNAKEEQKNYKCGGLRYFKELEEIGENLRMHGGSEDGFIPAKIRMIPRENGKTELQIDLTNKDIEELTVLKLFAKDKSKISMYSCEPFLFSRS